MRQDAQERNRPRWFVPAVIWATCGCAVLLGWIAWVIGGPIRDTTAFVVLTLLSVLSWLVRVEVVKKVSVAAGSIIALASFVLVGPAGSALINAAAMGLEWGSRPWRVRLFNAAMAGVCGSVGGLAYLAFGGLTDITGLTGVWPTLVQVGFPLLMANIVQSVINVAILGAIVWADRGTSYRVFVTSMLRTSGLAQIGYGFIGFLFVILWGPAEVGPFSAVLILLPLFVARWAFLQYGEEQRGHEQTLAGLVAAAENRDETAAGHSDRVAAIGELIGRELALPGPALSALRYSCLLHDLGMVGPPPRSADPQDPQFVQRVLGHPGRGANLLADIDFLAESLPGIRYHHERYDGRGFPDGLVADEIPLSARIVAVADLFDVLTTARGDRAAATITEALDRLWERSGSHLDATVVAALERAVERHRGVLEPPDTAAAPARTGLDHDDPEVLDALLRVGEPER